MINVLYILFGAWCVGTFLRAGVAFTCGRRAVAQQKGKNLAMAWLAVLVITGFVFAVGSGFFWLLTL